MKIKQKTLRFINRILPTGAYQQYKWSKAARQLWLPNNAWAKNAKYDVETFKVMEKVLATTSNAIDVGANFGVFTNCMSKIAPQGKHYAFEPVPAAFQYLKQYFDYPNVTLHNVALGDQSGVMDFYQADIIGYSGFKITEAAKQASQSSKVQVSVNTLDAIIPESEAIDFIKIDVEGAELLVLKGAVNTIRRNLPYIVFEFERHAEKYGTTPAELFDFLNDIGLAIWNMEYFLSNKLPFSKAEFISNYEKEYEFCYVAGPHLNKNTL